VRIGLIAPPFLAVPPPTYGGTELVIDVLARGLQEAGHDVTLFTVRESTCPVPRAWWYDEAVQPIGLGAAEATQVTAAYAELADVDVVHDHTLLGPLVFGGRGGPPVVTTCHSPFTADLLQVYAEIARRVSVVAISRSQRASAPTIPISRVVHHGLDLRQYPPGAGTGGYLLFLARMSPDKGPHRAIRIARAAGRRLVIVSKMREPDELAFFGSEVKPLLGPDVEFTGEVSAADRIRLLQDATALLNPIEWPEPFGLNMIEALACGTPVLTLRHGAAPEIVTEGRTGFLRNDADALVECVERLDVINRADCRAEAQRRFSMRRMVDDYLDVYAEAMVGDCGPDRPGPIEPELPRARAS
jgi:glycosyltransferase involved in cell wall biosynthesis